MTACDSNPMTTQVLGERIPGREKSESKGPKLGRILMKHDTVFFSIEWRIFHFLPFYAISVIFDITLKNYEFYP